MAPSTNKSCVDETNKLPGLDLRARSLSVNRPDLVWDMRGRTRISKPGGVRFGLGESSRSMGEWTLHSATRKEQEVVFIFQE